MPDAHRAVDAVWRMESARIVAGLVRMVGDVGLAEELAQDALLAALEQWPGSGVPDNPGAWLMAVAKRRAVDHLRRGERLDARHEQLAREIRPQDGPEPPDEDGVDDDVLRLMFVSCHPALPAEARVALTLRLLGGLRTGEIARAFLVAEPTVAQRVVRAKRTLAELKVPFEVPSGPDRAARLASVLEVVYLIFNEGYAATAGDDLVRQDLCLEALRLGRLLARLAPGEAEAHGLVALMELQASRTHARIDASGAPVALHDQQRARWDQLLIRRGFTSLLRARQIGAPLGPYVLQAAIAACHAQARTADATDWAQIAALYALLAEVLPTPIVQLNRAVAVAMAEGPAAGLALVDALVDEPALADYHRLPTVRGDLLAQLGRHQEAGHEFARAAALTRNAPERALLLDRAAAATPATGATLAEAAAAFLARDDLDGATLRSYGQTMGRLRRELGADAALASISAAQVREVFTAAWGGAAAATWNRHRGALRSFATWVAAGDLAAGIERRHEPRGRTRPLEQRQVEELCDRPGVALRERTLWVLLHESAAGIGAALALDVDDIDLAGRRARTDRQWIRWGPGAAELLPQLIGGRRRGPLFLSDRRPGPGRPAAPADRCPDTGRRRLSYARAEYLFKQATGHTLDQLRTRKGTS